MSPYGQPDQSNSSSAGEREYRGTVESIDKQAGTITVKKMMVSHTFKLAPAARASLSPYKVGGEVQLF